MTEPTRNKDINSLEPYVRDRVIKLLDAMKHRGFDPIIFEAHRSIERQKWLYGIGRTHQLDRRPVTWTLRSKHLVGKACDIVSKSHLWDYPAFYKALKQEAKKVGLKTLRVEQCHVEW
jgi:hypothetical protein